MKITDFIQKETIIPALESQDKKSVLLELSEPVAKVSNVNHNEIVKVLLDREQLGSTGIGGGIGIPHGKLKDLETLTIGFGLSKNGVDFESIDGFPTHIFFMIMTPENSTGLHLKLLAQISKMLRNDIFKVKLQQAMSVDEIYEIIAQEDENF
ncbi:MAG: PTS sugar transporter subunit IIA [Desulfobacterales bacterium]|nr:PTS sugar transporter subunit IIA [Desulfobacterales bacterium]